MTVTVTNSTNNNQKILVFWYWRLNIFANSTLSIGEMRHLASETTWKKLFPSLSNLSLKIVDHKIKRKIITGIDLICKRLDFFKIDIRKTTSILPASFIVFADIYQKIHCAKNVRIRSYSVRMRGNADQNNSEYRQFSRSDSRIEKTFEEQLSS